MMAIETKFKISLILCLILFLCSCRESVVNPESSKIPKNQLFSTDPMKAKIITSDIDLFWDSFDSLLKDTLKNPFEANYLKNGSIGLKDFVPDNLYPYGNAHEKELWLLFKSTMNSTELAPWLYSLTDPEMPQNLGYWMGYKIVAAYYEKSTNKKQAIKEILNIKDYKLFLEQSEYSEKFK